jgi:prophage tail gpP-like protein
MSKPHTVSLGDTLTSIAIIYYGDGRKYKDILEANPSISDPNDLQIGSVLIIPELLTEEPAEPAEIPVTPNTILPNGTSEEVVITIGKQTWYFWTDVTIKRSFDSIADSFSLSAPWFPGYDEYKFSFIPFKYTKVAIYIGGTKIMTGLMLIIKTNTSPDSKIFTMEGYSYAGVIADVMVSTSAWPVHIRGLNLKQIAEKIVSPFSLKVVFNDDPGPAFTGNEKQLIDPEEKIGDYLIKLARQRGFVIGSDPNGDMLFRKTTSESATVTIIEGQPPYLGSNAEYNGQKRYSSVTAVGTAPRRGAGQIATVDDPELKKNGVNRPFVFKASDTNSGNLKNAATAQLGRQIADSIKVNLNLKGFYRPDKFLWRDNEMLVYNSPGDMIYEDTEFLIRNVVYEKQADRTKTNLELVLPESYSGNVRSEFPWPQ